MRIDSRPDQPEIVTALLQNIERSPQLETWYECVNTTAVKRTGLTDHGPVHIRTVIGLARDLLEVMHGQGVVMSIETDHGMDYADAQVVVIMATLLHDIGMIVHREKHELFSVTLAPPLIEELLPDSYDVRERMILKAEILHAIYAHRSSTKCLTVEAGVVKVADALDMTGGRSRLLETQGEVNIHEVSAMAIEQVRILPGQQKAVRIEIDMLNSAGIFQIDELLKRKLQTSSIQQHVEIFARIEAAAERKIVSIYEIV